MMENIILFDKVACCSFLLQTATFYHNIFNTLN